MSRILTAEDSPSMREMVKSTLANAGYEVHVTKNGREALEVAKQESYSLVITDLNMPEMNGIELIRELRSLPEYQYTPILVLTTISEPEQQKQGRDAGATGWIIKPFDPDKLLAAIKRALG